MRNKGITLIALVVTVIILLILSGVTISAITGENGILKKAKLAKEISETSNEKESIELAFMSAKMKNSYEILQEDVEKELNEKGYKVIFDGEYYKITTKETKNEYIADKYGNIKEKNKYYYVSENVISDGNIKINVGDTINYTVINNDDAKYTSPIEKNGYVNQNFTFQNDMEWIVLGINNGGELLITSKESIKTDENNRFYLKGENGFKYGIEELDNICRIYGNGTGANNSRSIRIEDINRITQYDPMCTGNKQKYGKGNLNEYGNEVKFYWNEDKFPYYDAQNEINGAFNQEHNNFYIYDEKNNIFINNEFKNGKMQYINKLKTNFYEYYIDTLSNSKEDEESSIKKFSKAYNLIDNAGPYWLASKTVEVNEDGVYYGFRTYASWMKEITAGGFYSSYGNNNDGQGYNVRPVVTISDTAKLTGNSTNGWNIEE